MNQKKTIEESLSSRLLDNLMEGFQVISYDWKYLFVNSTVVEHSKSAKNKLIGSRMMDIYPGIENTDMFKVLERCMKLRVSEKYLNKFKYPDGSTAYFELRIHPVPEGIFILSLDITDKVKHQTELMELHNSLESEVARRTQELEEAKNEVEILLSEMHHRVKNNLQLISSILNLQSDSGDNRKLTHILSEVKDRIHSIALIHQNIFNSNRLTDINMYEYIDDIFANKIKSLTSMEMCLSYKLRCPKINLSTEKILPLGLLINELLTNSIKHAYHGLNEGNITVVVEEKGDNNFLILYSDDGSGIDSSEQNGDNGLGKELIDCFVDQLNGNCKVNSTSEGTNYRIEAKVD